MKTKDFLLGLIVGLPVGAILLVFRSIQGRFDWMSQSRAEVPLMVANLFVAIVLSNVIRKSKAGAWLHVAASDVPIESYVVEFVGVFVAACGVGALALILV